MSSTLKLETQTGTVAGAYTDIRASHGESAARALVASGSFNKVSIIRVGNY